MSRTSKTYLAVDLGASSGRVVAGHFDGIHVRLDDVHRFENGPINVGPRLYWRTFQLWSDILAGLRAAGRRFGDQIVSVGVDTWGVDFGLLDAHDELLGAPLAYRDQRTVGMMDRAFQRVARDEIFSATGLQFMELNTLYQLLAIQQIGSPPLDHAARLLMMPDLFHWMLSGEKSNEMTNASTTQLFAPQSGDWAWSLIERFELPRSIFGAISPPGTRLGRLLPQVERETGLNGVNVVLPGSHDTASAVLAAPAKSSAQGASPDWCYLSSGTWSLMGIETQAPLINAKAAEWNFTNEGGVAGTTRVLKNISGLWLVQECRRIWKNQGIDHTWEELTQLAAAAPAGGPLIDPNDARLVAPENMPQTLVELCTESGQRALTTPGEIIRCALESLATSYRTVFERLEGLAERSLDTIHIVGGGVQNRLLCQMTADACRRPVLAGPIEATALGNVMMQAIADGAVRDVAQARDVIRASFPPLEYLPR